MIIKKPDERFPTAPEGTFAAVCVDELDLGQQTSNWNGKERQRHVVRLVWQIDETDADGKRYLIKQDYTASLDEKAKLRAHLKSWRGRDFTFDEEAGFELSQVVGAPCMVSIVHNKSSQGGVFSNLGAVMKLPRGISPIVAMDYIRVKDRKIAAPAPPSRPPVEEAPPNHFEGITDDDVPF